jgi:hypothetical protein
MALDRGIPEHWLAYEVAKEEDDGVAVADVVSDRDGIGRIEEGEAVAGTEAVRKEAAGVALQAATARATAAISKRPIGGLIALSINLSSRKR